MARCPAGTSPGFTGQWPAAGRRVNPVWTPGRFAGDLAVDGMGRAAFGDPGRAEIGQFGLQALDLEPQRRAAGERQGHDAGRLSVASNDDRQQVQDLILLGRRAIAALAGRAPARSAAPRGGGGIPARCRCAASQSKRLSATTSRFSAGRQRMSAALTTASCRCAETTSMSSLSSATSLRRSMTRPSVLSTGTAKVGRRSADRVKARTTRRPAARSARPTAA